MQALQGVFEVCALLVTISCFMISGGMCLRRIGIFMQVLKWAGKKTPTPVTNSELKEVSMERQETVQQLSDAGQALRGRIVWTIAVVLLTFFVRIVFSLMNAVGNAAPASNDPLCGECDTCQTWDFLMGNWIDNVPEYQLIVVFIRCVTHGCGCGGGCGCACGFNVGGGGGGGGCDDDDDNDDDDEDDDDNDDGDD